MALFSRREHATEAPRISDSDADFYRLLVDLFVTVAAAADVREPPS
mgnify:CR=1 FL=1